VIRCSTLAIAAILGLGLAGCESFQMPWDKDDKGDKPEVKTSSSGKPAPKFVDIARSYNQRVANLDRVSAWSNIKLTYFDEQGEKRSEDPEGRLQIIRPNKLALTLGKAGQTVFWFGSDPERYWWIDLTDKAKPIAASSLRGAWAIDMFGLWLYGWQRVHKPSLSIHWARARSCSVPCA
jgi:hypothetical protein